MTYSEVFSKHITQGNDSHVFYESYNGKEYIYKIFHRDVNEKENLGFYFDVHKKLARKKYTLSLENPVQIISSDNSSNIVNQITFEVLDIDKNTIQEICDIEEKIYFDDPSEYIKLYATMPFISGNTLACPTDIHIRDMDKIRQQICRTIEQFIKQMLPELEKCS